MTERQPPPGIASHDWSNTPETCWRKQQQKHWLWTAATPLVTVFQRLLEQTAALFDLWHRVHDGTLSRPDFQTAIQPIRREIVALLQLGTFVDHTEKWAGELNL